MAAPNTFLGLPREIRDQIIGQLFFPAEEELHTFEQDNRGLAQTARRQISPYHPEAFRRPKFDVAILRVCRQIQFEGEAILYGTSSLNLMYDDWTYHSPKLSYQFLERLPKRLRRLVQRVERKCYSEQYAETISLFEWDAFMRFLAEECPALHTLILWGPGDRQESPEWILTCTQDHAWVQSILRIKTLHNFDIPVIRGGNIYSYPEFRDEFLPWLRRSLTTRKQIPDIEALKLVVMEPFRLLELPLELQRMIFRETVLSDDRRIYMDKQSWFNKNAQDALSMMLTCRKLYIEVGTILYEESVFHGDSLLLSDTRYGDTSQSRILPRFRRDPGEEKPNHIMCFTRSSKFQMKHLDILWETGPVNMGIPTAQSHAWNLRPASINIHISSITSEGMEDDFSWYLAASYNDQKLIEPRFVQGRSSQQTIETLAQLKESVPRHQWAIGNHNLGSSPFALWLSWIIARTPKVKFYYIEPPYAEITEDYAIWLTKGLREEWLRGEPSLPGIEWLFDGHPLEPTNL